MPNRRGCALLLFVLCSSLTLWSQIADQAGEVSDLLSVRPTDRILGPIVNDQSIVLYGQRHPSARAEFSIGKAAPDLRMEGMVLVLGADAVQEAALEELIRAQHDPGSAYYHDWLTPAQFRQAVWGL